MLGLSIWPSIRPSSLKMLGPSILPSMYSGGWMRFYGKNGSFCVSTTTESMKTNNIPLKSPIKLPPEMQKKKILYFSKFVDF